MVRGNAPPPYPLDTFRRRTVSELMKTPTLQGAPEMGVTENWQDQDHAIRLLARRHMPTAIQRQPMATRTPCATRIGCVPKNCGM